MSPWQLRTIALVLLAITLVMKPSRGAAQSNPSQQGPFAGAELGVALATGLGSGKSEGFGRALSIGLAGGYRESGLGALAALEFNAWRSATLEGDDEWVAVTNVGAGGEYFFAGGRLRTRLVLGVSVLTVPTAIDTAGTVGLFLDLRPIGLRWALGGGYVLGLDPLALAVLVPVLTGIPLLEIQYRTSLLLERSF